MSANEIHVGDVGTVFTVTVKDNGAPVDISSATVKNIIFRKPNATSSVTKSAAFVTDGTDGKLKYTTVANDLDTEGRWTIQAYVEMPAGKWHTSKETFVVHENL